MNKGDVNPNFDFGSSIFVFGSNLSGIHGAGAAAYAVNYKGAIWGKGEGHWGQSYALPTKGYNITDMDLKTVAHHVEKFLIYAEERPSLLFQVTAVGCGLAGFRHVQVAPMFRDAPSNCFFDDAWRPILETGKRNDGVFDYQYWGTY